LEKNLKKRELLEKLYETALLRYESAVSKKDEKPKKYWLERIAFLMRELNKVDEELITLGGFSKKYRPK
jgi:hypothetical protein